MVVIIVTSVAFVFMFLFFSGFADYADKMSPNPKLISLGILRFLVPHYPYGVPYKEAVTRKIWDRGPFLRREYQRSISVNVLWMLLCMAASSLIVVVAQVVAFAYPGPLQQVVNVVFLFNIFFVLIGIGTVFTALPKRKSPNQ